jgi:hypothetical protein
MKVVWLDTDRPWSQMVKGFFFGLFYLFKMKFSQRYIADMLGIACNSQLPYAKGSKGYRLPFATAHSETTYIDESVKDA